MAITVTQRGAVTTNADANPVSIGSVALTSGKFYVAVICTSIASGDAPSITGITATGLSMARFSPSGSDGLYASRRIDLWYGNCTSSGTVTVSAELSATSTQSDFAIYEIDGVDNTGENGVNAIVQCVALDSGGTSVGGLDLSLAAFASSDNRPFAFAQHRANEATAHNSGAGYTELLDGSHNSPSGGFCVQWHSSSADTTPSFTWTTSSQAGGIGIELKAAGGGGSTLEVPAATLTLNEQVPALAGALPVPSAMLTLAEQVPELRFDVPVPSATLTLTGHVPTLSEGTILTVPSATLELDGQVPTLVEGTVLTVPDATLTLTGQTPTLSESGALTVPAATLTLNEQAPTLLFGAPVPSATLILAGQVPTLSSESSSGPVALRARPRPDTGQDALLRVQRLASMTASRRARRTMAVHGPTVVGPVIETSSTPRVVLQSDFPNLVSEPSVGAVEVEIVRDQDGRMRFYLVP